MEIKIKNMTNDIIEEIKSIDERFYKENYTINWYQERYDENDFAFCLYDKNKMVGYICVVGIKNTLYDDIKKGQYDDDYNIKPNLFDLKSKYMYIPSINILEKYRHRGYGKLLLEEALNFYNNRNIIAITITKEGYELANKYMEYIKNVNDNVAIFEKKGSN